MHINLKLSTIAIAMTASMVGFGAKAQSIDIQVTGTITPPACAPNLASGGVIDYGKIPAEVLYNDVFTRLDDRSINFSINCSGPTRVAISALDNRESTRVPGILEGLGGVALDDDYNFGLGASSDQNIGGYSMIMAHGTFTADEENVWTIVSKTGGTPQWEDEEDGRFQHGKSFLTSWSKEMGGKPIAFNNLSGMITVQTVIKKKDDLPLGNEITLDGLATLELVYL